MARVIPAMLILGPFLAVHPRTDTFNPTGGVFFIEISMVKINASIQQCDFHAPGG